MGRRKFSMGGKLHGRNMLISEYIFVICVEVLGSTEIFRIDNSNDSIEQMGRKQVSSHMQVVKKFFEDLRCCKLFFLFPLSFPSFLPPFLSRHVTSLQLLLTTICH